MTAASAAELTALYQSIFGANGAHLTAITTQLQNNANAGERMTVKIESFSGAEDEDPVEWLRTFERAAIMN